MTGLAPPYVLYLAAILVSAVMSMYSVKKIIFITQHRKIYDIPDNIRKIHGANIPSLGGIGIFIGYVIAASFFIFPSWFYVIASSVILFFTGIYDDIMNMRPSKKLLAQLVASLLAVYFADIRITDMHGLFGLQIIPNWLSVGIITFCCTFFINVFNFVDGIDGLACFLAILYTGLLGLLFAIMGEVNMAGVSFGLMGATAGLLYYNFPPAKIYMGDTGSMMLGFSIFLLSILFIHTYPGHSINITSIVISTNGAIIVVTSILFLPVFDALRVFALRAAKGISPLNADRTHLHYYILDAGFNHSQAGLIIISASLIMILAGYLLQNVSLLLAFTCFTAISSVFIGIIAIMRRKRQRK